MKHIHTEEGSSFLLSRMKKAVEGEGSDTVLTFTGPMPFEEILTKLLEWNDKNDSV